MITSALMIYGYINYRMPREELITIDMDKPIDGDGYRMVAISDVHLGYGTTRSDLARYVDMINSHNPDVVVIAGDLIDNSIEPVIRDGMLKEFERITAKDGIYMVPGNHEYISGIDKCVEHISTSRIHLLRDTVVKLSSGVQLIGRDDMFKTKRRSLESLFRDVDTSLATVVLDHQPNSIAESAKYNVDIHISGHTHRGQVWPLNWVTDAMYDQSHGYRRWGSSHVVVSSGLSLWGPPFRIGSKSELWIIDLR
jgi:predicted MPP superfamily phosphohydrolase